MWAPSADFVFTGSFDHGTLIPHVFVIFNTEFIFLGILSGLN
jgi:hypothetical protein